jgi:hypothetical protein
VEDKSNEDISNNIYILYSDDMKDDRRKKQQENLENVNKEQ